MQNDLVFDHLTICREDTGAEIVSDISFRVAPGKVLALIGESGSGKTTISLTALGYVRAGLRVTKGSVHFGDTDVLALSGKKLRDFRGAQIAYIAQSAAAAFNPCMTIGVQVSETARIHNIGDAKSRRITTQALYTELQLPDVEGIGSRYPHEVSGGQLQRLMAAMAMSGEPACIVFDEPTTALDVTTQVDVLQNFKALIKGHKIGAIYVSHDLAVVAQIADEIIVLKAGKVVEQGSVEQIITNPQHEYTKLLIAASDPDIACAAPAQKTTPATAGSKTESVVAINPVLSVRNLSAGYGGAGKGKEPPLKVLHSVDMEVKAGAIHAIIGESGSGKSTLARAISGLMPYYQGDVQLDGISLSPNLHERSKTDLARVQMVMQMADVALNPAHRIEKILRRPIEYFTGDRGSAVDDRIAELMTQVKLSPDLMKRLPRELSGGQKQRINLARALAGNPRVVLCDEVTSALDTVVRNAIIDLIRQLRDERGLSFVLISHDISTVAAMCDSVTVMHLGQAVEQGPTLDILRAPKKEYTRTLMRSVPHLQVGWLEQAIAQR
ncbi:ABC transporter ATP-binding protein [Pseudorhodobacter sp. W20_MBD10_FR17]|uniref:ABC transporter ATP-binding protein n=1 Tax=Pseudorhodobacter sp. W20_MBD10_FR17 TaxID=3240266 RepID=UPI003F9AE0D4